MPKAKKIKAEEEVKEEKDLEVKDEKDLDKTDAPAKSEKEPKAETEDKAEDKEENLIVLDNGATVDENVELTEEEANDLAKITKEDGTEIFVEKIEGDEAEKKEVYEAIVEAETPAAEVADDLESEVNEELGSAPIMEEEIDEVAYVPAACHTAHASLNNSYYIVKLKSGKIKALKAGKILNRQLKASIIKAYKEGKKLPEAETVFNKIAHKIGYTFGAFTKLASKLADKTMTKVARKSVKRVAKRVIPTVGDTVEIDGKEIKVIASKNGVVTLGNGKKLLAKQLVAAELPDTVPGKDNQDAALLENFSLDEKDIKKSKVDSEIALDTEKKQLEEGKDGVKSSSSKVKSLYSRLPSKSGVGDEVEWGMKEFNKERNKSIKTLASQVKALRDATKEIRAQKEVLAAKDAEIKSLQEQLASYNTKEETMLKSAKINKILASMNIEDAEERAAMTEKFAKYTKAQLDAVYETMTANPSEEAVTMHERLINDEMKKEASALEGFVPSFKLEEEVKSSSSDEMEALVLQRELDSIQ